MSITATLEHLLAACGRGSRTAAIRLIGAYQPSGGPSSKVFPPTYPDVGYLLEERFVAGTLRAAVVLDAVQSQANRLEEALLDAAEAGEIDLPYIEVAADLAGGAFRVTSLDAPHRSPDAYFRDAQTTDGVPFDKSPVGQSLRGADERNARAIFEHSPTDLVLGMWDSQRGGRGLRLARAYSSEIVGLDPHKGSRGAGRLDPYNIRSGDVYFEKGNPSNWSFDKDGLADGAKPTKGKPSNLNHGNVPAPDSPGGVAVTSIERVAVVSLAVLQRLRFPDEGGVRNADVDAAGRAVLAAIALLGDRLAFAGAGLFLRSGCDLVLTEERVEWVNGGAEPLEFTLGVNEALELYRASVDHAAELGLHFATEPVRLEPNPNLRKLIEQNLIQPISDDDEG